MQNEVKHQTTYEKMDVLNDELHVLRRLFERPPGAITPELLDVMRMSIQYIHNRYQTLAHDVRSGPDKPTPDERLLDAQLHEVFHFLESSISNGRIVSSNDLTEAQIAEAQASGRFFVDLTTSFGWAMIPWGITTPQDGVRELARQQGAPG